MPSRKQLRWQRKFTCAFRGLRLGVHRQDSFYVHVPVAILVLLIATWLRCSLVEFCLLLLCIGVVLVAELANSAIERLAQGLCKEHNSDVGAALDISSAAVLVASMFAAVVGIAIFGSRIW